MVDAQQSRTSESSRSDSGSEVDAGSISVEVGTPGMASTEALKQGGLKKTASGREA